MVPHEEARLIRIASRRYHIPAHILAGMIEVESGFNADAVSPAGAFGETQFMPGTAPTYGVERGHSHHAKATQILGGAKYLRALRKGRGLRFALAAYNGGPGNPQYHYADDVLAASQKYHGLAQKSSQRGPTSSSLTSSSSVTGLDLSGERDQLKFDYLQRRGQPGALLDLGMGLQGAQDIAGGTVTSRTGIDGLTQRELHSEGVHRSSVMLDKALGWERTKVPYLLGGGHGSIAKPGDRVDCSGYVSAVLGLETPQVSGNLAHWGKPGKGKWVTVYANDGHVFMSIRDPKTRKLRWFGTSRSNPGGGAGEMSKPPASYLSQFAVRHPG